MRGRVLGAAVVAAVLGTGAAGTHAVAQTGRALPGLEPFDVAMRDLMTRWDIPGAGLAVAKDGRIVLVRGYGFADRETKEPVQPTSLFRIGSVNKTMTAVAVLKLVEEGRIRLDDRVLPMLGEIGPRPGKIVDIRVHDITVRQLLQHSAGFDRDVSKDPLFPPRAVEAGKRQGAAFPPSCESLLRDTLESSLDFTPGTKYAYSNVGYCILGRIVERASGVTFNTFLRERIFAPIGVTRLRPGKTIEAAPGEVRYYDYPGAPLLAAMEGFGLKGRVPAPYGGYALEAMDSLGQYIGAPVDLLRFMLAIDGQRGGPLLRPESLREMRARPAIPGADKAALYYGLGVSVRPVRGGDNWFHTGSQSGVRTLAVRYADGAAWAVMLNTRPRDRDGFAKDLDNALIGAAQRVGRVWPGGDLYDEFR